MPGRHARHAAQVPLPVTEMVSNGRMGAHAERLFTGRLRAEFPSQIIVDVTEDCNLECGHCASPAFRRSDLYTGAMLPAELNTKLCEEVAEHGRGHTQYLRYAASGEPLLHDRLVPMIAEAVRTTGVAVTLTTNGTLLDTEQARGILETGLDLVDVSIDAARNETYARVRRGGDLDVTRANVLGLLALREEMSSATSIVVSFVEQRRNTEEVDEFEASWRDAGADDVVIRRLHSNGGANRGIALVMHQRDKDRPRTPCLYPWERAVLGPTGHVGFCPADWTHAASIGDYRQTTIRELWQGDFLSRLREAHCSNDFSDPRFSLCAGCPDWAATRWPDEGRSYADMVSELAPREQA